MYPILIPVKTKSERCPNKNKTLFPYIIDWLNRYDLKRYATVIATDDWQSICNDAVINLYKEDKPTSDFDAMMKWIYGQAETPEYVVLFPVTQPLKDIDAFLEAYTIASTGKYDVITTKTYVQDRKIFYLNDKDEFEENYTHHKGALCEDKMMADGTFYFIKTSFLRKVMESNDQNVWFWLHSKKKFIINYMGFFDIDTIYSMKQFQNTYNFINKNMR